MASLTCLPDEYLNEDQLTNLFDDFSDSIAIEQSPTAVFSSLVNNVRHVYMAALLRAKDDMLAKCNEHAAELARLTRERTTQQEPSYIGRPANIETAVPSYTESSAVVRHAAARAEQAPSGDLPREATSWPAEIFTLYIGSASSVCRRDLASWHPYGPDNSWIQRLDFKVFKFEEVGTILIHVVEKQEPHREMVNVGWWTVEGWKHRLTFHAFSEQRPGTQMIWVAFRANPDRCIFVKGGIEDTLDGWERRLQFWVPK